MGGRRSNARPHDHEVAQMAGLVREIIEAGS